MSRPFLVIGAMKSGTTTLEEMLWRHPDVAIVAEKESTSFAQEGTGRTVAQAMLESSAMAAGEVSTAYMQRPLIHVDAYATANWFPSDNPLGVLAVLRDPFARAVSHWRHWAQLGRNASGEPEDLLCDPHGPYVAFSSYHRQLTPWVEACGSEQVLPLRLEDYSSDPTGWVGDVSAFLGLGRDVPQDLLEIHLNDGATRVVARGAGAWVARSTAYRSLIRPLVPSVARRMGAMALGGRRGGGEVTFPPLVRERFLDVIAEDAGRLRADWSHLTWDAR